ncbi:MAG: hypothetical protein QM756_04500 [Polyangiaceae bacterium]
MRRRKPLACGLAVLAGWAFASGCGDDSTNVAAASGGTAGTASAAGGSVTSQGGASAGTGEGGNIFEGGAANGGAPVTGGAPATGGFAGEAAAGASAGGAAGAAGAPGSGFECVGTPSQFASSVRAYEFGAGQNFGQDKFPDIVLGAPRGGGCCKGSLDVASLGDGGFVELEFAGNVIVNGDGPDFLVFENAFVPAGAAPESVFAELGKVSVSQDGDTWFSFECTSTKYPFGDCAGWHPVLADVDTNGIDATDPATAGGDPFDLATLGLEWARYVRIDDRSEADGGVGTFDLDAVAIVHGGCP